MKSWDVSAPVIHAFSFSAVRPSCNEVLTHATTWMSLESLMPRGRRHTDKGAHFVPPFIRNAQNGTMRRDKK